MFVTSSGRLGVLVSSERYKTDITTLEPDKFGVARLRPVSFRLKSEPNGAIQYGLIAAEVEKVLPGLVIRDGAGKIQGVRYDELATILLNEIQGQQASIVTLANQNDVQAAEIKTRKQQVMELGVLAREVAQMHEATGALTTKNQLVARR